MQINVMQTSGDVDEWNGVSDALEDDGTLLIVTKVAADVEIEDRKIIGMTTVVDQGPDLPPMEVLTSFRVEAVYAAGMWMKVEFGGS